jgi:uncharacterized integral membrane protein
MIRVEAFCEGARERASYAGEMTDDRPPDEFEGSEEGEPSFDAGPPARPESTGIAWGFVAVLILALLVAVFIVQNDEPIGVEFLWFDFEMSIWIVVLAVILITLVADQVISLFYRRRKRKSRWEGSEDD